MLKILHRDFGLAVLAAGLGGLAVAWSDDGYVTYGVDVTEEQKTSFQAVYDAYDPSAYITPVIPM